MRKLFVLAGLCLTLATSLAMAQVQVRPIPERDFDRLSKMIKPQPGESPWRDIKWMTNITAARQRSVSEDKPIIIFTAADGSPLSRT